MNKQTQSETKSKDIVKPFLFVWNIFIKINELNDVAMKINYKIVIMNNKNDKFLLIGCKSKYRVLKIEDVSKQLISN